MYSYFMSFGTQRNYQTAYSSEIHRKKGITKSFCEQLCNSKARSIKHTSCISFSLSLSLFFSLARSLAVRRTDPAPSGARARVPHVAAAARHCALWQGEAERARRCLPPPPPRIERRRRRVAQYGHQFTRDRVRVHVGRRSRTDFPRRIVRCRRASFKSEESSHRVGVTDPHSV